MTEESDERVRMMARLLMAADHVPTKELDVAIEAVARVARVTSASATGQVTTLTAEQTIVMMGDSIGAKRQAACWVHVGEGDGERVSIRFVYMPADGLRVTIDGIRETLDRRMVDALTNVVQALRMDAPIETRVEVAQGIAFGALALGRCSGDHNALPCADPHCYRREATAS